MKDVAVIIINYNSSAYTLECIDSVIRQTSGKVSVQIIVVDNNSSIEQFQLLKDEFPKKDHISLHRSIINTGFGGGNMYGAQFANAKYLLFLNNDALLLNDCISVLYDYMEEHQQVGVCTAQNYDENNYFVPSFDHNKGMRRLLFGRGYLEKNNPQKYPPRKREYNEPVEVNWVNGAFMFFRREAFADVGGFDTNIFLYWEEMDICFRLKNKDYKSVLVPTAKILHYQGASTKLNKIIKKESYISFLYVISKNRGWGKYITLRIYLSFVMLFKPRKWYLLPLMLKSNYHTESLKHKQKVHLFKNVQTDYVSG